MQAPQTLTVFHDSDVGEARRVARAAAAAVGFGEREGEEVALVAGELASNLVRHAGGGSLTVSPLADGGRAGVELEATDSGPGIPDVERAIADGFSTAGGLGYGLGTVNRLMDELSVTAPPGRGTRVVCRRWVRRAEPGAAPCPLAFAVATRAHPQMAVNGDTFVVKRWGESALVGVIDGLGHGHFAHRAAETARQYVEAHYDQPLAEIFRGTGRACRATRGVVMALARFDWGRERLTFASVGNVEARVFDTPEPVGFHVRRGIVGANAPPPAVTEHPWDPRGVLVLYSDGVRAHWRWDEFPGLPGQPADAIARQLLRALARDQDDATVLVVKGAGAGERP